MGFLASVSGLLVHMHDYLYNKMCLGTRKYVIVFGHAFYVYNCLVCYHSWFEAVNFNLHSFFNVSCHLCY